MVLQIALIANNGSHLVAQGDGRDVLANANGIGAWETFRLFNRTRPGEEPRHGDSVVLQAWNSRFLSAAGGGGGSVNAALGWIEASTTFVIERVGGAGTIRSGEQVALRAANGNYIVAEGGGGGVVNANRTRRGPWETFTIQIFRPQLIRLHSSSGRYTTAEGGGGTRVIATRTSVGLWETFSLINLSRPERAVRNGDVVALQTWNGKFVQVSGTPAVVNANANRAFTAAQFTICASDVDEIGHGQRVNLQSRSTSQLIAVRAGVLVADRSSVTDEAFFTVEFAERSGIEFRWVPDGATLPDRPFASAPSSESGEHNLLVLHLYDDTVGYPPLTASNEQIREAIYGRAPSLAVWLRKMSAGAIRVRDAGVYGPLRVPSVDEISRTGDISPLLTAAEDAGAPLSSFARDGVIDNGRVKLVKLGPGAGGQMHGASGVSRRGIRFSDRIVGVGVSQDVDEGSRMVLCHEISHLLLNVADRYGERQPLRGDVIANRTWVGDWEKFVIERVDGTGPIGGGHRVMLRAHNGRHLSVGPNPPNFVNTEGPEAGDARVFMIANLSGGEIRSGSHIGLRSNVGQYVTAELGGNSTLTANRTRVGEWEKFEIRRELGTGSSISSGDQVSLRSSGGFYVVAETDARSRPRDPRTDANDQQRGYIWGAGAGQGGYFDNSSSNYRAVMLSLWDRIRLGWARARYLTPDNRGSYLLRPFIDSRQALILFDPQNPTEWYTVENRQRLEDVDEVPSSGIVISWLNEDEGYWRWWFNRANDPEWHNYRALYPAVISAAAPTVPPNMMARPVVFNHDLLTKRNDPGAAFTDQEVILPLGNGDPSRFHLSFHPVASSNNVAMCIR